MTPAASDSLERLNGSPSSRSTGAAPAAPAPDVLVQAWVAALVADRGADGARRVLGAHRFALGSEARREALALVERPPRLFELADRVHGTNLALTVYRVALGTIDGQRPSGRVFLDDLAEALLLPPTLIRALQSGRSEFGTLAA